MAIPKIVYCPKCGTKNAKFKREAYVEAGDYDESGCSQEYDDQMPHIEYQCSICKAAFYIGYVFDKEEI